MTLKRVLFNSGKILLLLGIIIQLGYLIVRPAYLIVNKLDYHTELLKDIQDTGKDTNLRLVEDIGLSKDTVKRILASYRKNLENAGQLPTN